MADGASIVESVASHAKHAGARAAIIAGDEVLTYQQLWEKAQAAAGLLRAMGATGGDRVVLGAAAGQSAFCIGYLGAHLAGLTVIPVSGTVTASELDHIRQVASPALTFVANPKRVSDESVHATARIAEAEACSITLQPPVPDSTADILFTSGTTGKPKGVMLSHRNIRSAADHINRFVGNDAQDTEVVPLPLSHSFGLGRFRCNLIKGGTIVLTPGITFPGVIAKALDRWRATGFASVPAGFAALLHHDPDFFAPFAGQLRYMEIGSAEMPQKDKRQLMQTLPNTRICMHYGLTEASRSAFTEFHSDAAHPDSVGRPAPSVRIRITDADGDACNPGQSGRICIQGDHVMQGYLGDEEATRAALQDGWLVTEDVGHLDADGLLYLEGREGDLINVGGRKVSPLELEQQLLQVPGVKECACVAVPDPKGLTGEAIKALLVAEQADVQPAPSELIAHLRGRVEAFKIPSQWEWCEEIPRTSSGKIQRRRAVDVAQ